MAKKVAREANMPKKMLNPFQLFVLFLYKNLVKGQAIKIKIPYIKAKEAYKMTW